MANVNSIIEFVETSSGHPLNKDEGVQYGNAERDIAGATVCWMATPEAITRAGESGHDLLIAHESLYYPYNVQTMDNPPTDWRKWQTNRQRRELLEAHDLTFIRLHGSLDDICIFDDFAALLGFGKPAAADGLVKVYDIEECSIEEMITLVKRRTGMTALRVARMDRLDDGCRHRIRRVGLPWGGLGLFVNVGYQQKLIKLDCDLFIAGESDNYGFRFAQECGIPTIETSHEISENPGLRHFSEMLNSAFPGIQVHFFENPCTWEIL